MIHIILEKLKVLVDNIKVIAVLIAKEKIAVINNSTAAPLKPLFLNFW